jgi:hypothetical protein
MMLSSAMSLALAYRNNLAGASLLSYDFTYGTLPAGVTLTRASTATRVNSSGFIESVAAGVPRFDYDPVALSCLGILIEPQRTNFILQSRQIAGGSTGRSVISGSVSDVGTVAPDGSSIVSFYDNTDSNYHCVDISLTGVTAGKNLFSAFVRDGNLGYAVLRQDNSMSTIANLTNTAIIYNSDTPLVTGCLSWKSSWKRFWRGNSYSTAPSQFNFGLSNTSSPSWQYGLAVYTGTGAGYVTPFGLQVEIAASGERVEPTSYIPTTSSATTRAADQLSFTIPAGVTTLRYTFDDDSTQDVAVSTGAYTVPTNLNRAWIKTIIGSA